MSIRPSLFSTLRSIYSSLLSTIIYYIALLLLPMSYFTVLYSSLLSTLLYISALLSSLLYPTFS